VFDRASKGLGIDSRRRFAEKLSELEAKGIIGADEKSNLDILTDAGSAAAHRGWKPSQNELDTMMNIIEPFIHRNFILKPQAESLRNNVPKNVKLEGKVVALNSIQALSPKHPD